MIREDDFRGGLLHDWDVTESGSGQVKTTDNGLLLHDLPNHGKHYANAQISDYRAPDYDFDWAPPLRMTVTAQASGPADTLRGTCGFGFWNHPFSPDTRRVMLPRAIWFFFGSPPHNMALALDVPGSGWTAGMIDATRPRALALAPFALPAVLLMKLPFVYRALWPPIQRALTIHQCLLGADLLAERHTYTLEWREDGAVFAVDGETVFETPAAPQGKMGFVTWIDNQYAIVTPQGHFGWGVLPLDREQWLRLEGVQIEAL